jgi:hypothetical protein
MPKQLPVIEYRKPPLRPDAWQWQRLVQLSTSGCFAAALYCGFLSLFLSHKLATPTAQFIQFQKTMRAQAATRPVGTVCIRPPFAGTAYVPRPLFMLATTYIAIGFASIAIVTVALAVRRSGRAG